VTSVGTSSSPPLEKSTDALSPGLLARCPETNADRRVSRRSEAQHQLQNIRDVDVTVTIRISLRPTVGNILTQGIKIHCQRVEIVDVDLLVQVGVSKTFFHDVQYQRVNTAPARVSVVIDVERGID